jgi:hypothetical protein
MENHLSTWNVVDCRDTPRQTSDARLCLSCPAAAPFLSAVLEPKQPGARAPSATIDEQPG